MPEADKKHESSNCSFSEECFQYDNWNNFVNRLQKLLDDNNPKVVLSKLTPVIESFESASPKGRDIDNDKACLDLSKKHIVSSQGFLQQAVGVLKDLKLNNEYCSHISTEEIKNFVRDLEIEIDDVNEQLNKFIEVILHIERNFNCVIEDGEENK